MDKNIIKKLTEEIRKIEEFIPISYQNYKFDKETNLEEIVKKLDNLFEKMEEGIAQEHKKPYVTDDFENKVKSFAKMLAMILVKYHNNLKEIKDYSKLLERRHYAYGFYASIEGYKENNKNINEYKLCENIRKEKPYNKILYSSLVEYFKKFYGKFYDNESAIKILCSYYSDDLLLNDKMKEDLAEALYSHISNAGSPGDIGFAYGGIEMIKQWIDRLSNCVITKLLERYEIYKILNNKIYRKQIFAIINHSKLTNSEKKIYKFFFIDSILLANRLNKLVFSKYVKIEKGITPCYNLHSVTFKELKLPLFEVKDGINSPYAYWTYEQNNYRVLKYKDEIILSISYDEKNGIILGSKYGKENIIFEYENWMLDKYNTEIFENKLESFFLNTNVQTSKTSNQKFTFSYIYLNNYRSLSNQELSFDHKYCFNIKNKGIVNNVSELLKAKTFYGKNVYSLSCIVGKNGTGKTSILEFLRGSFFKFIQLIESRELKSTNGLVNEKDYLEYGILDRGSEFLVVFNFDNRTYYLTNIDDIKGNEIEPYTLGLFGRKSDLSKVVYFSNMININDLNLYTNIEGNRQKENSSGYEISKSLINFRSIDYSERASFFTKKTMFEANIDYLRKNSIVRTEENRIVNKDLCYQLTFLDAHTDQELEKWFDRSLRKEIVICEDVKTNNVVKIEDIGELKKALEDEDNQLRKLLYLPHAGVCQ